MEEIKDVVTLVKLINRHTNLTPQEKVVGTTLALSYIWAKGFSRLALSTLSTRSCMSESACSRALKGLVDKDIFKRTRTGRATIYRIGGSVQSSKIVDTPKVGNQTRQKRGYDELNAMTAEERHCRKDDEESERYLNER